jgi:hypothetical protein
MIGFGEKTEYKTKQNRKYRESSFIEDKIKNDSRSQKRKKRLNYRISKKLKY